MAISNRPKKLIQPTPRLPRGAKGKWQQGSLKKGKSHVAASIGDVALQKSAITAQDRLEEVLVSKARCRKEITRLNATVAKLTATLTSEKPKKLYLDEKALAERWSMSVQHIRKLRSAGVGPLVTYFGRSVRYRLRDIRRFEKSNAFTSRSAKEQSRFS